MPDTAKTTMTAEPAGLAPQATADALIRDLLNSIEQGVLVWDADSICQMFNERIFTVLEIGKDELYRGAELNAFLYKAVRRKEVEEADIDEALTRLAQGLPHTHKRKLRSGRQVIATARPRNDGGGVITFSDVSGLLKQEAALQSALERAEAAEAELASRLDDVKREKTEVEGRQAELQRMSLVATHTTDMIIIADAAGRIEWVNAACAMFLERQAESILGRDIVEVIAGASGEGAEICRAAMAERARITRQIQSQDANGAPLWLEATISPVFTAEGQHAHVIAVGRDITRARIAHEKELDALAFEQRKREESHLLSDFNEWLHSSDTLDELFAVVSGYLGRLMPDTKGTIYIYSNSRDVLEAACSWNDARPLAHFQAPECWALRRGRSYFFSESALNFPCQHVQTHHGDAPPAHYFCLPIIAHGDTVGLMYMEMNDCAALDEMQKLAGFCAEQISLAIANVRLRVQLRDQSTKDPLTALYNRRHFLDAARRELGRARNDGGAVSIISLDVDHFKLFNDTYGHDAGDMVLRALAETLAAMFRVHDVPCRYGGEEFVVLMPGANNAVAMARADELRRKIEAHALRYGGEALKITISAGVSTFPDHGDNVQALLKSADEALYQAKEDGRNRICPAAALSARAEDDNLT